MTKSLSIRTLNSNPGSEFFFLYKLFEEKNENNIVFVARDNKRSQEVFNEISFLHPQDTIHLPAWDVQPYDLLSPSSEILHSRIAALNKVAHSTKKKIIVTSVEVLAQKIIPKDFLESKCFYVEREQKITQEKIISFLIENGYERTSSAHEQGEFAVRGDILDIFANGYKFGHRIDFFGNQIEKIRSFDPVTQVSKKNIDSLTISPPSEIILNESTKSLLKDNLISKFGTKALNSQILEKLENQVRPIGIEQWYSFLYKSMGNIFEYINNAAYVFDFLADQQLEAHMEVIQTNFQYRKDSLKHDKSNSLALEPTLLYNDLEFINSNLTFFSEEKIKHVPVKKLDSLLSTATEKKTTVFKTLSDLLNANKPILICANTEGGKERIKRILIEYDTNINDIVFDLNKIKDSGIFVAPFSHGFETDLFTLLTENDLFGEKILSSKKRKHRKVKNLLEQSYHFQPGEIVVHQEHGIGRFEGLETLSVNNTEHDCLKLIFHGDDKLYVPVEYIDQISKYGLEGDVKLDKLGNTAWQSRKSRTKNQIRLSAEYLVKIAAERSLNKSPIILPLSGLYEEFCTNFPHVETEDQLNAVEDILEDFKSSIPMDRLVCGDVGFGKTEVALRASFVTVKSDSGKKNQVALICPTTLLSRQHYRVFSERMKKFGIVVHQLSRMVKSSERAQTIKDLESGKVDILVGTHAALSDKVKFNNLSLLIIDEEQHFGVEQKEKLKKLKSDINILTLSATPIPRTLQLSLSGIRDLSLISTPPVNRLLTKTSVMPYDPVIIKEAIMREYYRGGQTFYVCPRISELDEIENNIKSLAPELKYIVAHGQMPPGKLDVIMNDFYDGKYDILISTTIIESGIDIPKANTLIVHRADKFGLSQLYQIRGRVGRSNVPAFAYFTLPNRKKYTSDIIERLQILQNIDSLGAGFSVATHDMDTRGFGNLLGDKQSGHVKEVGVELYQELLREEINKVKNKNQEEKNQEINPQINIGLSALIPEEYIEDIDTRLNHYRRTGSLKTEDEIQEFIAESVDRFGPIPEEFNNLILIIKLKLLCKKAFIKKLESGPKAILVQIDENIIPSSEKLLNFIQKHSYKLKLRSNNEILLFKSNLSKENDASVIEKFIKSMYEECFT